MSNIYTKPVWKMFANYLLRNMSNAYGWTSTV